MAETERVTMLWPKELKDAVRAQAGKGGITEFVMEAVELHLGVSQDLHGTNKELGEVKHFAQQMADQLVLGVNSPEERLQSLMEIEFPSWINTTGWPETYASRVRPEEIEPVVTEEIGGDECGELEPGDEDLPLAANVEPDPPVEEEAEEFVPKDTGPRDDLFAKVMAKTGGKLTDVPGLKVASEIEKPAPRATRNLDDIQVDF